MWKIFRSCIAFPALIVAALFLAFLSGYVDRNVPILLRDIPESLEKYGITTVTVHLLLTIAVIAVLAQLLKIAHRVLTERIATATEANIVEKGISILMRNSYSWHLNSHVGKMQVRLERSSRAITDILKVVMMDVVGPVFAVAFTFSVLFGMNAYAAFGMLGVCIMLTMVTIWQIHSQNGIRVGINRNKEELGGQVSDAITRIEQIKIFASEDSEVSRTKRIAKELSNQEFIHHLAMGGFDTLKAVIERGGMILVVGLALIGVQKQQLQTCHIAGVLIAVMLCTERILEPLRMLHRVVDELGEKLALAKDFLSLSENTPSNANGCYNPTEFNTVAVSEGRGIVFQNVCYRYHGKADYIFDNANVSIPVGARVVITGANGSGKSTWGRMTSGLLLPESGAIYINGETVGRVEDMQTRKVGMLTQGIHLIPDETILENIRYGLKSASDDEVFRAAELAGVDDSLIYDNGELRKVSARGQGLSGGQIQRIGLARVLLQNPEIVIFDEPTSAQDLTNRGRFFDLVLETLGDRTMFVISHEKGHREWASHVMEIIEGKINLKENTSQSLLKLVTIPAGELGQGRIVSSSAC